MNLKSALSGLLLILAVGRPGWAQNGYQNVVNREWDTVTNGPLGGVVLDCTNPRSRSELSSRLRGASHRGVARRTAPPWFAMLQKLGLLPADQPLPTLPLTAVMRSNGRLVLPDQVSRSRQAELGNPDNRLTFSYTPAAGDETGAAWSTTQQQQLSAFLASAEATILRVFGPPAYPLTVRLVHDPSLSSLNMGVYDATNNEIRLELNNDIDHDNPLLTPLDERDLYVLTLLVLKAYRDDAFLYYDCWEDGMERAAQLLVISEVKPEFGYLARDVNLLYSHYELLNQPGLEGPSYVGTGSGSDAQVMRDALGTVRAYLAQAAWLKVYAENPDVFRLFNAAYYQALASNASLSGNIPLLRSLVRTAAPTVEGLGFDDWYRRQHVFNTAVVPGAKLYVFNSPDKDFFTGEPTNSLGMNIYHFQTTATNEQRPLSGTARMHYTAYDGFDLDNAVFGASGSAALAVGIGESGNEAGIGGIVPLFFNIAGDQNVQQQRIEVRATCNGIEREIYYPYDVVANDNQVRNDLWGVVTNGYQGALTIDITGKDPIEVDVIQGSFKCKVPGGLPVPATATFTFQPDSSGGTGQTVQQRSLGFLGPIGTGTDVEVGDTAIILETPPESFQDMATTIPAGLRMITIPAWAKRTNASEVLGVPSDRLLLARADGAVASYESYRRGDIYQLWPNIAPFRPGYAYWVSTQQALEVSFQGIAANRDRAFPQTFPTGWQQFGNPFSDLNFKFADLQVQAVDGDDPMTLAQAQTAGLVSSGIFRYNPDTGGYSLVDADTVMTPYEGFWINILDSRGATILFPNALSAGRSRATGRTAWRAADRNEWQVKLVLQSGDRRDDVQAFGIGRAAGNGYSTRDLEKPPPFGSYLSASFPQTSWGDRSGRYAVDLREADGAAKSWDMVVETNLNQPEVTLSWPELANLPGSVSLVFEDLETGVSRSMRSTAAYTFRVGSTGQRQFRITADPRGTASLAITTVGVQQTRGGGSVAYTITAPAEMTVLLKSATGRQLRTLESSRAVTRGTHEVAFVPRDAAGRPLPNGIYRLDLIAVDELGRQVRTSRLVRVER